MSHHLLMSKAVHVNGWLQFTRIFFEDCSFWRGFSVHGAPVPSKINFTVITVTMTTPPAHATPPRPPTSPRLPTSSRLSQTLPQYLVRLAHEPSVGLHFLASHAQSRAVPALAAISRSATQRRGAQSEAVLDARDAADMLRQHGPSASAALQRIVASLQDSTNTLQSKAKSARQ